MDVIAGSVPRADGAPFQPSDLNTLWLSHGRAWVQLHSKLAAKGAWLTASNNHALPCSAVERHAC